MDDLQRFTFLKLVYLTLLLGRCVSTPITGAIPVNGFLPLYSFISIDDDMVYDIIRDMT